MKLLVFCSGAEHLHQKVPGFFIADKNSIKKFSDGEVRVEICSEDKNFSFKKCTEAIIIQSLCSDDKFIEVAITADALKRAGVKNITLIAVYFGYLRQDRRTQTEIIKQAEVFEVAEPISSALMINFLENAGINKYYIFDPHLESCEALFKKSIVERIFEDIMLNFIPKILTAIAGNYVELLTSENFVLVAPDAGSLKKLRTIEQKLQKQLNIIFNIQQTSLPIIFIEKCRGSDKTSKAFEVFGDVKNKHCLLYDDISSTASTLCNAADALYMKGAAKIFAFVTHCIISEQVIEKLKNSKISQLFTTNSIDNGIKYEKIKTYELQECLLKIYSNF